MKKILFAVLSMSLIFTSCTKDEEEFIEPITTITTPPVETTSFTCKIDGVSYDGSSTVSADVISDFLTITTSEGGSTVSIKVPGISVREVGDTISFLGAIGFGNVITPDGTVYSNTYFDASKGSIIITAIDLDNSKVSGTFFFEAEDVASGSFVKVNVTSGEFTHVSF